MHCNRKENFDKNAEDFTILDAGQNVKDLADLFEQKRDQSNKNSVDKL